LLEAMIEELEAHPDLAGRAAYALGVSSQQPEAAPRAQMTFAEYLARAEPLKERTLRYYLKDMVEGQHFHRQGRKGGRIIFHVAEADAFCAARRGRPRNATSADAERRTDGDMVKNEVARGLARNVLTKAGIRE
jgi:hypothetical protein